MTLPTVAQVEGRRVGTGGLARARRRRACVVAAARRRPRRRRGAATHGRRAPAATIRRRSAADTVTIHEATTRRASADRVGRSIHPSSYRRPAPASQARCRAGRPLRRRPRFRLAARLVVGWSPGWEAHLEAPAGRGWRCCACVALAAAGAGLRPAPAAASASSTISSILQKHDVAGAGTGVFVWDFDAARQVYASHADTLLAPASNMKLVTTSSALDSWGPEHRFKTELYGPDVPVYDGVLYGDLYLKGYGDPSLSTLSYQREVLHLTTASFESFAKRLRTLKVRKVKGRVLGDESWFDKKRTGPSWKPSLQLECGPLSALSGNESLDDGNRVKDPAAYAARLLTEALRARGHQGHRQARARARSPTRPGCSSSSSRRPCERCSSAWTRTATTSSPRSCSRASARTSTRRGAPRPASRCRAPTLAAIGLDPASYRLLDGSGLSYEDRLTASDLVRDPRRRAPAPDFDDVLRLARHRRRGRHARGPHARHGRRRATPTPRRARSTSRSACPGT